MSSLTTRATAQTAGFLILFALIFVAAGTTHFWQGWLFCLALASNVLNGNVGSRRDLELAFARADLALAAHY